MLRCLRWTQWHAAWIYSERPPSDVELPIFTPLPKRMRDRNIDQPCGSGDLVSDRSSMFSGDSILNSDKSDVPSTHTSSSQGSEIEPF